MTSLIAKIEGLFHSAEKYVIALGKRELHVAADSKLGVAILTAIKAGEAGTDTLSKMGLALASFMPTLKAYVTDPAFLEADLETVGKSIIEDVLAQVKTTGPLAIFETLIEAL